MILMFPCNYIHITQLYKEGIHNGIDITGNGNQDILSCADGEVVSIRNNYLTQDKTGSSYGNYVKIKHNEEFTTLVAHLKYNSVVVKVGDKVKKGDKLGIMGSTGHSTGIHTHFEVFKNNKKIDPLLYTYVHKNQIVFENSKQYIKSILEVNSLQKDNNLGIIKVNVLHLSIRKGPGTNFERIGFMEKDKTYNYYDVIIKDDYKWYRIGENDWVADNGSYLTVYEKDKYNENNNEANYKFTYSVEKTGYYKIKLNKDEILYIE